LNIASRSVYEANTAPATSMPGPGFSPWSEFNGFNGAAANWPLTETGKAALARFESEGRRRRKIAFPFGVPTLMFYPVADTIAVQRDRVVMKVDWMNAERIIYLDGRKHPPASETFLLGHSVGHWEGDTLVAETTNFQGAPDRVDDDAAWQRTKASDRALPCRSGSEVPGLFRRRRRSGLSRPTVEWSAQWMYRPNMPHSNEKCDCLAHKYLGDFK
jgi:hypothetical protein